MLDAQNPGHIAKIYKKQLERERRDSVGIWLSAGSALITVLILVITNKMTLCLKCDARAKAGLSLWDLKIPVLHKTNLASKRNFLSAIN